MCIVAWIFAMLMLVKLETFGDTVACIVVYFYSLLIKPIQRRREKKVASVPYTYQSNDVDDVEPIYGVSVKLRLRTIHTQTRTNQWHNISLLRFNAFD